MRRFSILISRYVLQAVLPYFVFTWLLLSVILFVQQASRFSDVLFNTALPSSLVWQLTIALIPNVIAFTCPIAALVGVIIGLSRMQGDSEMVTIRAAGVGNIQIAIPLIILGIVLSLFAFLVNLAGVPIAARMVRQVALKAALHKLESPIEPGVFNTEINDLTIYVKRGNLETGIWENIFVQQEDEVNDQLRLITAKQGRIDSKGEDTEIVLNSATITTFDRNNENKISLENVRDLRLVVQTKRGELIKRLTKTKESQEEMGLQELAQFARKSKGRTQTEAYILWQRRVLLSITPLLFVLLGMALVLKINRGGRGFGIFLALVSLAFYYLLTLLGEQLARTGAINVFLTAAIPLASIFAAIIFLFISQRLSITRSFSLGSILELSKSRDSAKKVSVKSTYIDFTTGILDFDLIWNLVKHYILTLSFLIMIFLIFTVFELWKFAGTMDNGVVLLLKYLFFLVPFIYVQVAPSSLMIATLATYVIKSRQNEIVSWTAAGQSVYRLLLPCFVLMGGIGILNLIFQESILTHANRTQDSLLAQIRSRNAILNRNGKYWISSKDTFYSFENKGASDNEIKMVKNLRIYQFDSEKFQLTSFLAVDRAAWDNNKIKFLTTGKRTVWNEGKITTISVANFEIEESYNPFKRTITKPNHLSIFETTKKLQNTRSENERRNYLISLQKKYSTAFLPFIITLFTAPFALSLSRKGTVVTLGYAVAFWLVFMGATKVLEQFGSSGFISPFLAVWSPLVLFTILGLFLMTRIKT